MYIDNHAIMVIGNKYNHKTDKKEKNKIRVIDKILIIDVINIKIIIKNSKINKNPI